MKRQPMPKGLFDAIENESLANVAVRQIENLILGGVLTEGMILPGERDLAEQLGISRPKVREALKQLAECKLLKIVPNEGIYVDKLGGDAMSPALIELYKRHPEAIQDNLEYRREQEGFAARLAAQRATPEDHTALKQIIAAMSDPDGKQDLARAAELDLKLHLTIAFSSHNRTLIHMMTSLYRMNRSALFYNRGELMNLDLASENLLQQHKDIVDAICAGQPAQAEEAAKTHISYVIDLVDSSLKQRERQALSRKREGLS